MMQIVGFTVALCLSFLIICATAMMLIVYSVRRRKRQFGMLLRYATAGVFLAVMVFLFPVCYHHELAPAGTVGRLLFTVFMSAIQTVSVFLVDAEFGDVAVYLGIYGRELLPDVCRVYFLILSVIAPVLTAGILLTFVNELWVRLRLFRLRGRKVYAFNELSERSLAIAQSIAANRDRKAVMFFANVFAADDEAVYELSRKVKELRDAHCCKRDIVELDKIIRRGRRSPARLEYFLVSEKEAENVNHAIELRRLEPKIHRVTPHVYAVAVGSANSTILDSLNRFHTDKDSALVKEAAAHIPMPVSDPSQSASLADFEQAADEALRCTEQLTMFSVRRVHPMRRLAWDVLTRARLQETAFIDADGIKTISLLLVGCGRHGMEFLKTAIWLYQLPDYRLEINVVDLDEDIRDKAEGECPELMSGSDLSDVGETQYSLRFFGGMDVMRHSFWEMLRDPARECFYQWDDPARLRRTTAVLVALGDDDRNVEAAMRLRMLFDRLTDNAANKNTAPEEERVRILSIVYNESKAHDLAHDLVNYKQTPYNLEFIGDVTQMYSYEAVACREDERSAYKHHIHWIYNSRADLQWYAPLEELLKYDRCEYFRIASMAQERHKRFFNATAYPAYFEDPTDLSTAGLRNEKGRIIEHRRWNAFMRSQGYLLGPRDDRAKTHHNLVPYSELSPADKAKDA